MSLRIPSVLAIFLTMVMVMFCSMVYAGKLYEVVPGETLWGNAGQNHTVVQTAQIGEQPESHISRIRLHYHMSLTNLQKTAQQGPFQNVMYTVKPGDTLWSISLRYHVSIGKLKALNGIQTSFLSPGQKLQISSMNSPAIESVISSHPGLLQGAPEYLIPVYQAAAKKYGIQWTILAAIHKQETDFSTSGNIVSSAGAIGPMQFMPSTFAEFGVTAPGRNGAPDIHDVYDSIYTAAHMLSVMGCKTRTFDAIYAYNHSNWYVEQIIRLSQL